MKGLGSEHKNQPCALKGFGEWFAFVIVILLILGFFVAPLAGIVVNAFTTAKAGAGFTLKTFARVVKMRSFWPSVRSTVCTGVWTGALCTVLGFLYSVLMKFRESRAGEKRKLLLNILPMLPMSVSSVVVGVVITLIVRRGNVMCLIIAQTALTWPLAFRQIYPHMVKISRDTMDSAMMLSRGRLDTIRRVLLPVSRQGLISAFGFCFAVSAGDTTLPLVLAISKYDALSLFTYRLAGAYRFNEACACGVILGLLCAVMFALGRRK